jgi:hypothetical protein
MITTTTANTTKTAIKAGAIATAIGSITDRGEEKCPAILRTYGRQGSLLIGSQIDALDEPMAGYGAMRRYKNGVSLFR